MSLFVLEIGSEELPARFLPTQEKELYKRFCTALEENSIAYNKVQVLCSPRRAVVIVEDINPIQAQREEVVSGPPKRIAYDDSGKPSKALEGFLRTNNVSLEDVFFEETAKGAYVAVLKKVGGASTAKLLEEICPTIINALPFAKKMRWGSQSMAYARPLRWILALFESEIVPFSVGPVTSDRISWGHRLHTKQNDQNIKIHIANASDYLHTIRNVGGVEPDASLRRQIIIEKGNAAAKAINASVLWQESLLDEVQGLCEHPVPMIGNFDSAFLEVPSEALLTSMQSHQKSFGLQDASGKLLPHFLTVLNMTAPDISIVQKGWERVLRARLEDARFFWESDCNCSLEMWLDKLDNVIFLGPLGSMGDKTRRLEQLCLWLANNCAPDLQPADVARAGRLSKADLVSGMVGEFDTLQGIMGGIYARKKNESEIVAQALQEQYLPAGPDSAVPGTLLGALLSMADKADSLVGCFGLGMIPTGAADPNGLRRAVLGITRCILEFKLNISIRNFFEQALELYGQKQWKLDKDACLEKLEEFFFARLKNYWQGQGYDTLLVEAILNTQSIDIYNASKRLDALAKLHTSEHYISAVQTFKRVSNIIRKQGQEYDLDGNYLIDLLDENAEKALSESLNSLLPRFDEHWEKENYAEIPSLLLEVRPAIDNFFDSTMVMCEDEKIRKNRLNMLKALTNRMEKFADFTALQV